MRSQPEPDQSWPYSPGGDSGSSPRGDAPARVRPSGQWRRRVRQTAFGALLAAGLVGLAVSAVGIAHQLLPRQFTAAQRRAIATWEVDRRWRAAPAGTIFPASVPYSLSATSLLNSTSGLTLHASLLGISPATGCAAVASGPTIRVLRTHGCSAVLRATYVDATGSLVATVAVAVLPSAAAARTVVKQLSGPPASHPALIRALPIQRTPAADFRAAQRQISHVTAAESYVIMATAGFADGRGKVRLSADGYLYGELMSLTYGLVDKARSVLGGPPATPACPGTPGC